MCTVLAPSTDRAVAAAAAAAAATAAAPAGAAAAAAAVRCWQTLQTVAT